MKYTQNPHFSWNPVVFSQALLKKLNLDPALATGPFITTTNDIFGLLIYLGIATIFIVKLQ